MSNKLMYMDKGEVCYIGRVYKEVIERNEMKSNPFVLENHIYFPHTNILFSMFTRITSCGVIYVLNVFI